MLLLCRVSSFTATRHTRLGIVGRTCIRPSTSWHDDANRKKSVNVVNHGVSHVIASASKRQYTIHASFDDDIIDRYDAFILDQFGVLHNGQDALPGAIELVEYLATQKQKKLIILSNTSAPADKAMAKLPKFGFDPSHFTGGAVTSGEEASRYIRNTFGGSATTSSVAAVPKALMLTWDASDRDNPRLTALPEMFLEQCGNVQLATSVEEADLIIFHGSEVWYKGPDQPSESLSPFIEEGSFERVDSLLQACLEGTKNLPGVCANPDFVVQTPAGDGVHYMPGMLAARYQELGGHCQMFGKPGSEHFEACLAKLGLHDKQRVCHVGDSLHHDIAGASRAGIPSVLVTSGIHKTELGTKFGALPTLEVLDELLQKECDDDVRPSHVVPAFRLG
ncbi:HAD-like domain containing protein [Nitzschia inconspicua]|uniref:HAD-like domain containing protein n=1 Tax=Nitzschia inconspicua TaxID=303405 RepID=A0A9K3Q6U4_9STRA|nr:HAD-like domain containing protein [Nitzschia inconspicua]